MKKLSPFLAILLLMANMSCQKDDEPQPVSEQMQLLMAPEWGVDQVTTVTDYIMVTPDGQIPVHQEQTRAGFLDQCEYAATARFLQDGAIATTYLSNFCGERNPAAEEVRWSSEPEVTKLTFIGENVGGLSIDLSGNYSSIGDQATFDVLELSSQKLVITRTVPITDFFSQEILELYASQGISLDGTFTYTTTYLAQ